MDSGVVVQQSCTVTLLAAIGTVFVRDLMSTRAQGGDYMLALLLDGARGRHLAQPSN